LMIGIVVLSEKLSSIKEKRRKESVIRTFKDYDSDKVTEKDSFFFDYYLNHDASIVRDFQALMKSESLLSSLTKEGVVPTSKITRPMSRLMKDEAVMFEELKNEGFITIRDGTV